jgi:hypothetical protein
VWIVLALAIALMTPSGRGIVIDGAKIVARPFVTMVSRAEVIRVLAQHRSIDEIEVITPELGKLSTMHAADIVQLASDFDSLLRLGGFASDRLSADSRRTTRDVRGWRTIALRDGSGVRDPAWRCRYQRGRKVHRELIGRTAFRSALRLVLRFGLRSLLRLDRRAFQHKTCCIW